MCRMFARFLGGKNMVDSICLIAVWPPLVASAEYGVRKKRVIHFSSEMNPRLSHPQRLNTSQALSLHSSLRVWHDR